MLEATNDLLALSKRLVRKSFYYVYEGPPVAFFQKKNKIKVLVTDLVSPTECTEPIYLLLEVNLS